jgi:hypothetical protein
MALTTGQLDQAAGPSTTACERALDKQAHRNWPLRISEQLRP